MAIDPSRSSTYRLVSGAFGLLFAAIAIAIVVVSDRSFGPMFVAAALGILGVDALVGAFRSRPSLLSRIGPLP